MTHSVAAREMWEKLDAEERKKILKALDADEALHKDDFNALPPQVHNGIVAGMPVEPASEAAPSEDDSSSSSPSSRGRHRRGDD
jgi:hypothetical protein